MPPQMAKGAPWVPEARAKRRRGRPFKFQQARSRSFHERARTWRRVLEEGFDIAQPRRIRLYLNMLHGAMRVVAIDMDSIP